MAEDSSSITALVQQILHNLPEGANPWFLIRLAFTSQVRPQLEDSFLDQLYANSAIIAASTVLLALCMLVKVREGTYWIFRTYRGTGGLYIVVHYSNSFSTFMIVFWGLLQGYVWQTVHYAKGEIVKTTALWRTLVWYPGWLAFFLAAWSLVVSHILHLDSSGRPARTFFASAIFVNFAAIVVPVGCAVSVALLGSTAHTHYKSAMGNFALIDGSLAALERSFNGTFDQSLFTSGMGLQVADEFTSDLAEFGLYFRWSFLAYLIFTVCLEALLVVSATLHLRELRKTMDELQNRSQMNDETRAQEQMLERSYRGLIYVTWAIIASCTAINVLFAFVGIAGRKVVYDAVYSKVASLLPIWIFSAFGFPLSLLFLIRLLKTSSSPPRSLRKNMKSEEALEGVAVPIDAHGTFSNPSVNLDAKQSPVADEYAMAALGGVSYHPAQPGSDHSHRQSPSAFSQTGSEAHLVSSPAAMVPGGQPFYSSYETRPVAHGL
ncbi:hypothetical protein JCM10213_000519 [Rhodosporidiobolus nylandii]